MPIQNILYWEAREQGVTIRMLDGSDLEINGLCRHDFERILKEAKDKIISNVRLPEELEIPGIKTLELTDEEKALLGDTIRLQQEYIKTHDDKKYAIKAFDKVELLFQLVHKLILRSQG